MSLIQTNRVQLPSLGFGGMELGSYILWIIAVEVVIDGGGFVSEGVGSLKTRADMLLRAQGYGVVAEIAFITLLSRLQ